MTVNQDYIQYIHSSEWFKKREETFEFHGKECKKCGITKKLHVHHKTYKRLGNEKVEVDLVPLCRRCHKKVHKLCKRRNLDLFHGTDIFLDKKFDLKSRIRGIRSYKEQNPKIRYYSYKWRYYSNDLSNKTRRKMVAERKSNKRRIEERDEKGNNIDYKKLKEMYNLTDDDVRESVV